MDGSDIVREREPTDEAPRERPLRREAREETREEPSPSREIDDCPECDGPLVTRDRERMCSECGLVVGGDDIDYGPEWRSFTPEQHESRSRVGSPTTTLMHDRGLSTRIDWRDRDAYGGYLSNRKRQRMNRLRVWDERFRTRDASERNLKHALGEIERMSSALGIPEATRETASVLYRRALEDDLLPGRSIEGMATASLYAASRQTGIPRSINELASVSRVEELEVKRAYRYLTRELDLQLAPPDPVEYIGRYASALGTSDETERQARELLEAAKLEGVHSGKHPVGLAAAALYAASGLTDRKIPQSKISDVVDVSEVTIRNRYRELLDVYDDC